MNIKQKIYFLNKVLPNKENILLDYVNFNKKEFLGLNDIYNKWGNFIKSGKKDIKFYLHIPFCSRICRYCMYSTIKLEKENEIDKYINDLILYLEKFKILFKNIYFNGLYIGGGTPSILAEKQMDKLFSYVYKNFKFNNDYYRTIELNPSSTTFKKLDILKKYGFDRISFGVQSFNKKTLEIENRTYVSDKKVKNLVQYAKKLGFIDINIDIIVGLNNEGKEEILENINKLYNIEPYTITLYTILKDKERSYFYKKNKNVFYKEINKLYADILKETNILDKYNKNDWSHVLGLTLEHKEKKKKKKLYDAHSEDMDSLFGIGYKAYGNIWGVGNYEMKKFENGNFIYSFEKSNKELEIYKYILQAFQYEIDKNDFFKKFGYSFEEKFKEILNYLEEKKIIKNTNNYIKYIGDEKFIGYYGLLFLDLKNLIKFIKYRFYEKK